MHVIRHNYSTMNIIFNPMTMQAMPENQTPRRLGHDPAVISNKGDEERFISDLQMG